MAIRFIKSLWEKFSGPSMVTPEEIEGALHLPVLAIIPHLERRRNQEVKQGPIMRRIDLEGRWRSRLLIHFSRTSSAWQAYESLAKELHERSRSQRRKIWLVTASIA